MGGLFLCALGGMSCFRTLRYKYLRQQKGRRFARRPNLRVQPKPIA